MGICCRVPRNGPLRHFISNFLLFLSAVAVYIAIENYETPEDTTPSPHADFTFKTGKAFRILIIIISGLAGLLNLIVLFMAKGEDNARAREEEEHHSTLRKRNWLENFLDPRFLNTPAHIQAREKYFQSLVCTSRLYKWGFLLPSLSLTLILIVRLFIGAPVFLGDPKSLDFGWKYGIESVGDTDIYDEEPDKDISFVPDFNSFAHSIQGFLAALLATPILLRGIINASNGKLKGVFQLAPYALTIYPTYNLIKRFVRARKAFAGSSFANNGFEWAAGFILGLAFGQLITAASSCHFLFFGRQSEPSTTDDCERGTKNSEADGSRDDDDKSLHKTSCAVKVLQLMFALLLQFTVFAGAVLYGLSWYSCLENTSCVNADSAPEDGKVSSPEVMGIMLAIPIGIFTAGFCA